MIVSKLLLMILFVFGTCSPQCVSATAVANGVGKVNNFLYKYDPVIKFLFSGAWFSVFSYGVYATVCVIREVGDAHVRHINNIPAANQPSFIPSTSRITQPITFNDVAGLQNIIAELQDVVDSLRDPESYQRLGAQTLHGILLTGAPGNGKTLLVRALATEANCAFYNVSGSQFDEEFVGVGASRIRKLFEEARYNAPSIIFIDEIDAFAVKRNPMRGGGYEQTLNQLLTEMDGFSTHDPLKPVIVIGATNRADVLDAALLRPGRFDHQILVPSPGAVAREAILRLHAQKCVVSSVVDFNKIARGTPGFSGADLANLVNRAAIIATRLKKNAIDIHDFDRALDEHLFGLPNKEIVISDAERLSTAYHEAGHALVQLYLEGSHVFYKVTIEPRGNMLGVTHFFSDNNNVATKDELLINIAQLFGGRIAEELVFGKINSGACSDLEKATYIARNMVCRLGMSDVIGHVVLEENDHSEQVENEVRNILNYCYNNARIILEQHRDKLDIVAKELYDRGTLFASEVYNLLEMPQRVDYSIV